MGSVFGSFEALTATALAKANGAVFAALKEGRLVAGEM